MTAKAAVWPGSTRALSGLVSRMGAPLAGSTVAVAATLVTLPAPLLTTTLKVAPQSGAIAAGVEYTVAVAPTRFTPFFFH